MIKGINGLWVTTKPEDVSERPVRFLGEGADYLASINA